MGEIMGQVKWTTTNCTKVLSSPKKVMCLRWDWKWALYYKLLPENQMFNSNKYNSQLDSLKAALNKKCSKVVNRKCIIVHQKNEKPYGSLMTRQNCYSLTERFWFIHCILQTLPLWMSICFVIYKILLIENFQFPGRL